MGKVRKTVYGAVFLALGVLLPAVFHITGINGKMFLPMHYTVFLSGLFLGWRYGAAIGALTPLLASLMTGVPILFPTGVLRMAELAAYGACSGALYQSRKQNIYVALILSMISGRLIYGVCYWLMGLVVPQVTFALQAFLTSVFITALPGMAIQMILLPSALRLLRHSEKW